MQRHRGSASPTRSRAAGFTLVEVLVALTVMAVLSGLAWRGIDGMLRARDGSQAAVDRAARLNTILSQWQQDFAALHDSGTAPPLAFDGQTLLMTRTVQGPQGEGVALVAWSLRSGRWQRWVGPATQRTQALQDSWLRAQQLQGNEPGQVTLLEDVSQWQLYYYRGNAWSNSQSSGSIVAPPSAIASAPAREALPDGVRLVVTIGEDTLTRDIALGPHGQ